jgi:hypothetical protein
MRHATSDRDQLIMDRVFTINTLNLTKNYTICRENPNSLYVGSFDKTLLGILPKCSVLVGLIYYSSNLVVNTNE